MKLKKVLFPVFMAIAVLATALICVVSGIAIKEHIESNRSSVIEDTDTPGLAATTSVTWKDAGTITVTLGEDIYDAYCFQNYPNAELKDGQIWLCKIPSGSTTAQIVATYTFTTTSTTTTGSWDVSSYTCGSTIGTGVQFYAQVYVTSTENAIQSMVAQSLTAKTVGVFLSPNGGSWVNYSSAVGIWSAATSATGTRTTYMPTVVGTTGYPQAIFTGLTALTATRTAHTWKTTLNCPDIITSSGTSLYVTTHGIGTAYVGTGINLIYVPWTWMANAGSASFMYYNASGDVATMPDSFPSSEIGSGGSGSLGVMHVTVEGTSVFTYSSYTWYISTTSTFTTATTTQVTSGESITSASLMLLAAGKSAGTYYIKCEIAYSHKGTYIGDTATTGTISGTTTIVIEASTETTATITAATSLYYTGSALTLIKSATTNSSASIYYCVGTELTASNYSTTGSTTKPTKTAPGTYTVYYYIPASGEYTAKSGSVSAIINKAYPTVTLSKTSITDLSSDVTMTVTPSQAGTWSLSGVNTTYYTVTLATTTATANTATTVTIKRVKPSDSLFRFYIKLTPSNTTYYQAKTSTVSIDGIATFTPTLTCSSTTVNGLAYGDSKTITVTSNVAGTVAYTNTATVSGAYSIAQSSSSISAGGNVTFTITATKATGSQSAGSFVVTLTPTSSDYASASKSVSIGAISKAQNTFELTAYQDLVYNGSAQTLLEITPAAGTVYYNVGTVLTASNYSTAGSTTKPTKTWPGTYTVYYYIPEQDNYSALAGGIDASIAAKQVQGQVSLSDVGVLTWTLNDDLNDSWQVVIYRDGELYDDGYYTDDYDYSVDFYDGYQEGSLDLSQDLMHDAGEYYVRLAANGEYILDITTETRNAYELTFTAGGGVSSISPSDSQIILEGHTAKVSNSNKTITINGVARTMTLKAGYTALRWDVLADNAMLTTSSASYKFTQNTEIEACATGAKYTVTLDKQGGVGGTDSVTATYLKAMPTITAPARIPGYTFGGYYDGKEGTGTQYYNADGTSASKWYKTSATTLYAYWIPEEYTFVYDGNGGTTPDGSSTITEDTKKKYGKEFNLLENGYTKTGFAFVGWALSADGDSVYSDKATVVICYTEYTGSASVILYTNATNSTITLYAVWNASVYTANIKYETADGGTYSTYESAPSRTISGTTIDISDEFDALKAAYSVFASGFTFGKAEVYVGSATSATTTITDVTKTVTVTDTMLTEGFSITYYFARNQYTLTISANGGTYSGTNPITGYYQANVTLSTPTRAGYTHSGWTLSSGNGKISGNTYTFGAGNGTVTASWAADTYTITYNKNQPSTASSDVTGTTASSSHTYDTAKALTTNGYSLTGWTFNGWNTEADGSGTSYADKASVKNLSSTSGATVTLYAQWTANTYTVVFNANGGSGTMSNQSFTYDVEQTLTTNAFTRVGYGFLGWNTDKDSASIKYGNNKSVKNLTSTANGTVTLYVIWYTCKYSVLADSNGGTFIESELPSDWTYLSASQVQKDVRFDSAYGELPSESAITREGYTFNGWYTATEGGDIVTSETILTTMGAKIYAQWTANTYTVVYNGNGSTGGSTASSTHTYDTAKALTANGYTRTGYIFNGWNTKADGTGTSYADKASVKNLSSTSGATANLYAQWTANTYTVKYNGNGSTGGSTASSTHTYDTAKALTANGFTRTGHSFTGWATSASGSKVYSDKQSVTNLSSTAGATVNLYAVWSANSYTLTFNSNCTLGTTPNGEDETLTLSETSRTLKYGAEYGALPAPTRTGYAFAGWYTTTTADDGTAVSNTTTMGAGDTTVYVKWTTNYYTLTLNMTGGTIASGSGMVSSRTISGAYKSQYTLSLTGYRLGYTHTGWLISGNGILEDDIYTFGAGNCTVYAQWTVNTYKVEYHGNGGSTADGETVVLDERDFEYNGTYTLKWVSAVFGSSPEGYHSSGWATSSTATTVEYSNGASVKNLSMTGSGTIKLYAVWEANTYTVVYNSNKPSAASNDVTGTTANSSHTYDTAKALTTNGYSLIGWTFQGWATSGTATAPAYTDQQEVMNLTNAYPGIVTLYAVWQTNTYTVAYNGNGNTGGSTASSSHTYDTAKALTANGYTKTGYTFQGWATSASGSKVYSDKQSVTNLSSTSGATVALYAVWGVNSYTLTFNSNCTLGTQPNGTAETLTLSPTSKTLNYGAEYGTLPTPTRTGYTFAGWYTTTTANSGTNVSATTTMGDADVTVYAKWTTNQSTLTINANGGTCSSTSLSGYYKSNTTIPTPTRSGYTFAGWALNTSPYGALSDSTYTFGAGNDTATAQWTADTYTITYNKNKPSTASSDVTGTTASSSHTYDTAKALTTNGYSLTGWTFNGWNTEADGSGTSYADKASVKNLSSTSGATVTLYAVWEANTYTITLDKQGGTGGADTIIVTYDSPLSAITCPSQPGTGYSFCGYATKISGGKVIYSSSGKPNIATWNYTDITILYGTWVANWYQFKAVANDGQFVENNLSSEWTYLDSVTAQKRVRYNSALGELPDADDVVRLGYEFAGWYTEADGGDVITGSTICVGAIYTDRTMYAQWTPIEYSVAYDGNGSTGGSTASSTHTYDTAKALTANGYTRTGYTFNGWNTAADGSGTSYADKASVKNLSTTNGATVTLYAVWNVVNKTINLEYNGGTDSFLMKNGTTTYADYTFENGEIDMFSASNGTLSIDTSTVFNGSKSLHFTSSGTGNLAVGRVLPAGTYTLSMYIYKAYAYTEYSIYVRHNDAEIVSINPEFKTATWDYITLNFTTTSESAATSLHIINSEGLLCFDDIKLTKDGHSVDSTLDYTIETDDTQLPYAVKAGYTFLGWNTKADGTGDTVTSYNGNVTSGTTYYAIYKVSSPTSYITYDRGSVYYGSGKGATLTANVNTEGLVVDSINCQWYEDDVLIEGATGVTYYVSDTKDVPSKGYYRYKCMVSVTNDGVTSNYIQAFFQYVITYHKGTPAITVEMDDYVYGGTIATPSATTTSDGNSITYYYNTTNSTSTGTVWMNMTSTTLPVGTYYMYAVVEATDNYNSKTSSTVAFNVTKGTIVAEFITSNTKATVMKDGNGNTIGYVAGFDGNALDVCVKSNVTATLNYGTTTSYGKSIALGTNSTTWFSITNAGTTTYKYQIVADNYETITGEFTLTITDAEAIVNWEVEDTYTYNGADQSANVKAYITGVDGSKIYCNVTINNTFKNAGTYTATATLDNSDYTITNTTKQITIKPMAVTITAGNKTITYGDKAPTYTYTGTTTPDSYTVTYKVLNVTTDVTNSISTLKVGSYKIVPSSNLSTTNYSITYINGTLTINKFDLANATISAISDQTYTGSAITPTPTVKATLGSGTVVTLVSGTDFAYSYSNNTNAGSATVTVTGSGNYTGTKSATFNIVAKGLTKPTVSGTYTYDGTAQEVSLSNFDTTKMTVAGTTSATDAGTYTVTIALKSNNYTWSYGSTANVVLEWTIAKADMSLSIEHSSITLYRGDTTAQTNKVTLSYVGVLGGAISVAGAESYVDITVGNISNNISTLSIVANKSVNTAQTVTVTYSGDKNHNNATVKFTIIVPAITVNVVTSNGSVTVNNTIGSNNEVALNSNITFVATPNTNYGMLSYQVASENVVYNTTSITGTYTSSTIKVTSGLLVNNVLTITVTFDKLVTISANITDEDDAITKTITTTIDSNEVANEYDETNNTLTVFESSNVKVDVEASKKTNDDGSEQYYVVKEVVVGDKTATNATNTTIDTTASDLANGNITIVSAKVYNADDRAVKDGSKTVATLSVSANVNDTVTIENAKFVVENSTVNFTITENDDNYGFVGIKVGDSTLSKDHFSSTDWTIENGVYTWIGQGYTQALSEAQAVILEKWYNPSSADATVAARKLTVSVPSTITATLINTSNNVVCNLDSNLGSGSVPLYAGTWQVKINSGVASSIVITIDGKTVTPDANGAYTFTIDSSVSAVSITIS